MARSETPHSGAGPAAAESRPPAEPRTTSPPGRSGLKSGAARAALLALVGLTAAAAAAAQEPRLYYEQDGSGPAIVLVADWAHDATSWFRLLPPLRPGHRLVLYDLRGQGRSEIPADGAYSLSAHRGDLVRLLDGLGIERAHLVGSGVGGRVALDFALFHPDRVRSVTAISPRLGWSTAEFEWWGRLLAAWDRVGRPTLGEYASVLVARWFGTDFATREPWIVDFYDLMLRRQPASSLVASLEASLTGNLVLDRSLSRTVPVLLVRGRRDPAGDFDSEVVAAFPNARRIRLSDGGVLPQLDAPEALAREIVRFILAVESREP